jgi:NADH:ubiquinone oxidoreductase subunit E
MSIITVELCMGSSCFARGNAKTLEYLESYIASHDLSGSVELTGHLCLGTCSEGPNVRIDGILHNGVQPESVVSLLETAMRQREHAHG